MGRNSAICILIVTWVLAIKAGAAVAYTPTKSPEAVQLSPAVLLMGEYDWALSTGSDGKPWSRCLDMVWRARKFSNGNRLNIVPTHHWLPNSDGFGVSSFCYMHTSGAGDPGKCLAWTAEKLAEFKRSMTLCLTEAFKQGFIPYVRPHLDDGLLRGVWRNGLLFSPTVKYGDYSYADVMTQPLSEAMRDALANAAKLGKLVTPPERSRPVVYIAMQGEMSATVMRFTSAWASLIPTIKSTIGSTHADVKVGVGLNFNALDAIETQTSANTGSGVLDMLFGSGARAPRYPVPSIDASGVSDLLSNKVDFLGISAYAPYSGTGFSTNEFQNAAFTVGTMLANLAAGVNLAGLANAGKIELHYSEFGIGCGVNGNAQVAATADACAKQPWAGISGTYSASMDPWQRSDLSAFRVSFYNKAMDWFSQPNSGTYRIKEVFVWSMSSWDVFGIYPESGSYKDVSVSRRIAAYDTAVIAAQVCEFQDAEACDDFVTTHAACLNDQSGATCLERPSKPDIVTEAGPAPASASPTPALEDGSSTEDYSESGLESGSYINMSPGPSAASPMPTAASGAPSAADSIVVPTTKPTTMVTKNGAASRQLVWNAVTIALPLLWSAVILL